MVDLTLGWFLINAPEDKVRCCSEEVMFIHVKRLFLNGFFAEHPQI